MVDTQRSLEDILTNLFQDGQPDKSIDEQDIRDLVYSLSLPHGGLYMEDNAVTVTLTNINQWYKVAGTTTEVDNINFVDGATVNNRLIYEGVPNRHFHIVSNFDFTVDTSNQTLEFQWFKNTSTPLPAKIGRKHGPGTDLGAVSTHSDAVLSTNDYVELWARNITSGGIVLTVKDYYAFLMGMIH